ncbi:MAG: CHAP domain-containing protein, partial [Streptococcus sp.]
MAEHDPWTERGKIKQAAAYKSAEQNHLSKRQGLKQAKSDYEQSKSNYKVAKSEHKATIKAKQSTAESRERLSQTRHQYKVDKQAKKTAYKRIG